MKLAAEDEASRLEQDSHYFSSQFSVSKWTIVLYFSVFW